MAKQLTKPSNVKANLHSISNIPTSNAKAARIGTWFKVLLVVGGFAVVCAAVGIPLGLILSQSDTNDTSTATTTIVSDTSTTSTTTTSTTSTTVTTTTSTTTTSTTTTTTTSTTTTSTSTTSTSTTSTTSTTTSTSTTSTTSKTTSTTSTSATTTTTTTTTTTLCSFTCLNGGYCSAPNYCTCPSTYNGTVCQTPVCSPACQNSGNCTSPGVCTCFYGWTGTYCQTVRTVLWTFDNTLNDLTGQFSGSGYNSPTYVPGINGYGSAVSVNGTAGQCVVATPYLNMSYISFTWEFWVYPTVTPSGDSMFIGQCSGGATVDQCLIFMTRNDIMWFAFWGDDVVGSTNIIANRWSHMAFVYDLSANKKFIYLNGMPEANQSAVGPLQVTSTVLTFGCLTSNGGSSYGNYFTGYIDQMLFNSRVKNASEILNDATLVVYYRFLSTALLIDSGTNYINGTLAGGAVSTSTGIFNQAISFPSNGSYFLATGLVLLGTSNWPFSLSLWFKTTSLNGGGTLAHLSAGIQGTGWCIRFMGLTSSGNIEVQLVNGGGSNFVLTGPVMPIGVWNHAVYTFSTTNGVRLYVNGTLYGSTAATYWASGAANTLIFGNPISGTYCGISFPNQQFYGNLDEIRLFSREITASEVYQFFSNP